MGLVNELIQRSRTLTFELHPAMLDDLGLAPTLRRYAQEFSRHARIEVTVSEVGPPRKLPTAVASYLFRAIKELLHNAAKHGRANEIVASLHWEPQLLRAVIDDDGAGFDPGSVLAPGGARGLGLAGIRERLIALGGSLRLESGAGQGTRAVLELPLTAAAAAHEEPIP
jgi:two-component system sensor histidine kinase DegS